MKIRVLVEVLSKEIQISVSENDLVKNVLEKCLKQVNLKTEALGVFLHANTSKKLTYLDPNRPLLSYKPQEQDELIIKPKPIEVSVMVMKKFLVDSTVPVSTLLPSIASYFSIPSKKLTLLASPKISTNIDNNIRRGVCMYNYCSCEQYQTKSQFLTPGENCTVCGHPPRDHKTLQKLNFLQSPDDEEINNYLNMEKLDESVAIFDQGLDGENLGPFLLKSEAEEDEIPFISSSLKVPELSLRAVFQSTEKKSSRKKSQQESARSEGNEDSSDDDYDYSSEEDEEYEEYDSNLTLLNFMNNKSDTPKSYSKENTPKGYDDDRKKDNQIKLKLISNISNLQLNLNEIQKTKSPTIPYPLFHRKLAERKCAPISDDLAPPSSSRKASLEHLDLDLEHLESRLSRAQSDYPQRPRVKELNNKNLTELIKAKTISSMDTVSPRYRKWTQNLQKNNDPLLRETQQFSVPLDLLLLRESDLSYPVPSLFVYLTQHITKYGLRHKGLFRLSGNQDTVNALKDRLNNRELVNFAEYEMDVICSLFKQFLQSFPEPIIPFFFYDRFLSAIQMKGDRLKKVYIRVLISSLPNNNKELLNRLIHFLADVAKEEQYNMMGIHNISIIFSPLILYSNSPNDIQKLKSDSFSSSLLIQFLISQRHVLFHGEDKLEVVRAATSFKPTAEIISNMKDKEKHVESEGNGNTTPTNNNNNNNNNSNTSSSSDGHSEDEDEDEDDDKSEQSHCLSVSQGNFVFIFKKEKEKLYAEIDGTVGFIPLLYVKIDDSQLKFVNLPSSSPSSLSTHSKNIKALKMLGEFSLSDNTERDNIIIQRDNSNSNIGGHTTSGSGSSNRNSGGSHSITHSSSNNNIHSNSANHLESTPSKSESEHKKKKKQNTGIFRKRKNDLNAKTMPINMSNIEDYIGEAEFVKLFKITKTNYYKLPQNIRDKLKEEVGFTFNNNSY